MSVDGEPVSSLPNLEDVFELISDSASNYLITWPVFAQLGALLVLLAVGLASRRALASYVDRLTRRGSTGPALSAALAHLRLVIPALAAAIVVWLIYGIVHALGLPGDIIWIAANLLTAWVVIRLATSLIRQPGWASLIAAIVWGITALALLGIINSIVLFGIFVLAANFLLRLVDDRMTHLEGISAAARVLIVKILRIAFIVAAIVVALTSVGVDLTAIAIFSGAVGVGIGFGLQKVVSNLLSGIMLLLDRSLKPGDVIEIGDAYGWIERMSARYVTVATRDGKEYLIPNEDIITQQVINWSYSNRAIRIRIGVGISYRSDVRKAMALMVEAASTLPRVLQDETHRPQSRLVDFGESSVNLELRIWVLDPEKGIVNVSSEIRLAIWDAFQVNGIEFPFPQRDLHISSAKGLEDLAEHFGTDWQAVSRS